MFGQNIFFPPQIRPWTSTFVWGWQRRFSLRGASANQGGNTSSIENHCLKGHFNKPFSGVLSYLIIKWHQKRDSNNNYYAVLLDPLIKPACIALRLARHVCTLKETTWSRSPEHLLLHNYRRPTSFIKNSWRRCSAAIGLWNTRLAHGSRRLPVRVHSS